ncbi:MAG: ArnT family glycosyltransferase [Bryobacteraceae bacterium]
MARSRGLLLILAFAVLIHLPFLNQAIQGDDDIYLTEGAHAQIETWHPLHTTYVFCGEAVDLRGHPHPPLDGWVLGALIALFGGVNEIAFHAVYIGFTLLAAAAMWSLARRFSPHPVWATLLFLATPVFVVNGNSLEADLPFAALWMAAIALFCAGRRFWAAVAMALAALTSYQVVLIVLILAAWLWLHGGGDPLVRARPPGRALAWLATPLLALLAWQVFERWGTGAWPLAVTLGYQKAYQTAGHKLASALTLAVHALFLAGPLLTPLAAVTAWRHRHERATRFLLAWIGIFFAGSAIIFFAGSARYLLPMAAPVAILASASFSPVRAQTGSPFIRILTLAGFASQLALGLGLAAVNYQHWDGYRQFAATLPMGQRTWVNGEWGLRYYVERRGGLPLTKDQAVQPGDVVVSSDLSRAVEVHAPLTPIMRTLEIRPAIPLRLIGLESRSGYSTASLGFWPFGISNGVIDRVRAEVVGERHVTREYLRLDAPDSGEQVVSGVSPDHWMARTAMVLLANPAEPRGLSVEFYLPPQASARHVELLLDGKPVAQGNYSKDGVYTLAAASPLRAAGATAEAEVEVDSTFFAPGDQRPLGVVLLGIGFR